MKISLEVSKEVIAKLNQLAKMTKKHPQEIVDRFIAGIQKSMVGLVDNSLAHYRAKSITSVEDVLNQDAHSLAVERDDGSADAPTLVDEADLNTILDTEPKGPDGEADIHGLQSEGQVMDTPIITTYDGSSAKESPLMTSSGRRLSPTANFAKDAKMIDDNTEATVRFAKEMGIII